MGQVLANPVPFLVFGAFVFVIWLFRKPISLKIEDIWRLNASKKNLNIEFAIRERASEGKRSQDKSESTTDIVGKGSDQRVQVTEKENPLAAFWYKSWRYEKIIHDIYPGQVELLKHLSTCPRGTDTAPALFERFFVDDFLRPYFRRPYTFIQYIHYLAQRELIAISIEDPRIPLITISSSGRDFLLYIVEQGYSHLYVKLPLPREPATVNASGRWVGYVIGDNRGSVEVDFNQDESSLRGEISFNDVAYGKVKYEVKGGVSGGLIEGLLHSPTPLEEREGLLFSPIGLIVGVIGEDGAMQGTWTMSVGHSGQFTATRLTALPAS